MHLQVHYHQGFGMSLFFIMAQMVCGHPGAVVFVQYAIGCAITGYIICDLYFKKGKRVSAILLAILFFTPFMMYFAFFPMRAYRSHCVSGHCVLTHSG